MQFSAQELKEKLLRALDRDNNVIDMPTLLEVFTSLERLHVTKDLLEETRLGKYVNEMRKKTTNKDLAKRAKNLVRKWQAAVMPQAAASTQINGDKAESSPQIPRISPCPKPASPASRPDTPLSITSCSSMGINSRLSPNAGFKPASLGQLKSNNVSPALNNINSTYNTNNSANSLKKQLPEKINGHNSPCRPTTPASVDGSNSISKTDVANKRKRRDNGYGFETPVKKIQLDKNGHTLNDISKDKSVINGAVTSTPKQSCVTGVPFSNSKGASSENVQNLVDNKLNKSGSSMLERIPSSSSIYSDRSESISSRTPKLNRTPRPKTTAELVAELASSSGLNVSDSVTVRKIVLNQIHKEHDFDSSPVVPDGARPRARRKNKSIVPPQTSEKALHETKNEMVQKFLESAVQPQTSDFDLGNTNSNLSQNLSTPSVEDESLNSVSVAARPLESFSFSHGDTSGTPTTINSFKEEINKHQNSLINKDHHEAVDPWALLPPVDRDNINWNSLNYNPLPPVEVNEENINKLQTSQWPGVNGQYDHWNNWNNWSRTYSMPSYNGDMLHILPYVVLDDINEEILPEFPP